MLSCWNAPAVPSAPLPPDRRITMIRFPRLSTPIILAVTLGAGFILWQSFRIKHTPASEAGLVLPRLSAQAAQGKIAFDGNCATCHGVNAAGTGNGPPLVHNIYNPGDRKSTRLNSSH